MDIDKIGSLIRKERVKRGYTQAELGALLSVTDKAVSKWERGLGMPDLSIIQRLSEILSLDIKSILSGSLEENDMDSGNFKRSKFFVCPECGNIMIETGCGSVGCCGKTLSPITPVKAVKKLSAEVVGDEIFISSDHEMSKENYISFVALVTGETMIIRKLYPEWNLEIRLPLIRHSTLYWYSLKEGLSYQYLQ